MPISSGAEGHVGVGVNRSIKWVPEGGEDYQALRISNSYLQRYLNQYGGQEMKKKEELIKKSVGSQKIHNTHNRMNIKEDSDIYHTEQRHGPRTVQGSQIKEKNSTMYTLENARKTGKEESHAESNNTDMTLTQQQQNKAMVSTNGPAKKSRVKERSGTEGQEDQEIHPTKPGDFSDPVYKEIAFANGCINRMSKEELKAKLTELNLDTRGVRDVLKKRLKNYCKRQKLKQPSGSDTYYDYICVIDFEATCEEGNAPDYIHEIIEFPIVLVNTRTLEIEDTFQQYVRPEIKPRLSEFCINLTGITQELVDQADTFPVVLQRVVDWMRQKELGTKFKYAILTDGSWDMSKFLNMQCHVSRLKYPRFAKKWINIRKCYGNFYKVPRNQTRLTTMLEKLGLKYDGRLHCGLDDSKNIARIAIRMLQDGCELRVNEKMHTGQLMNEPHSLPLEGAPIPHNPQFKK